MSESTPSPDDADQGAETQVEGQTSGTPLHPDNPDRVGIPSVPDPETQEPPAAD